MCSVSFLSLMRKGLLTCMNFVDCTILSMSSSNSFSSSTGGGFLVDLKPYVSLEEVDTSGLRKKYAFQRILRRKCSVFSIRHCKKSFCDGRGIFFVEYPMLSFSIADYRRVLDNY